LPNFRDKLPLEVVRDLLGITRAMFLAARKDIALAHQLDELTAIGKKLRLAFDLARKTDPDTLGHRAAWGHAEEATTRLMKLMTTTALLFPVVEASVVRFRRVPPKANEREEKRAVARKRS